MNNPIALLLGVCALVAAPFSSQATLIYNASLDATIQFSQPWLSVAPITTPDPNPFVGPAITEQSTSGSGAFTAFTDQSQSADLSLLTFSQRASVHGSVGNSTLDQSGSSAARSFLVNLFTFDFGNTPTTFTLSALASTSVFGLSADRPVTKNSMGTGERLVSGSTGFQLIMDGSLSVNPMTSRTVPNLTGVHTVRFTVLAEESATAVYPFVVPDTGKTLAMFGLALALLAGQQHSRIGALA